MFKIKNNKGFTLVEIVVATGLLAALSLGVTSVMHNMQKGQVSSETKMEELELKRLVTTALLDQAACVNTFTGTTIGTPIASIKNASGGLIYQVGGVYGNNALKILSMTTVDKNQVASNGTRSVDLIITIEKKKILKTTNNKPVVVPLNIVAANASALITGCFSDSFANAKQSCETAGGTWTGTTCSYSQFVLKTGDTMTGNLKAPGFIGNLTGNVSGTTASFSNDVTSTKFCSGANCKSISELALANQTCPNGQVSYGIKSDGTINCKPLQCGNNQYFAGLDNAGNPVCRPYPTNTCPTNEYVSSVNNNGTVNCTIIPNTANATCPPGQVIQSINAGIASCVEANSMKGKTCAVAGQLVTGIDGNGNLICNYPSYQPLTCPVGSMMIGIAANGTADCRKIKTYLVNSSSIRCGQQRITCNGQEMTSCVVKVTSSDGKSLHYNRNIVINTADGSCTMNNCDSNDSFQLIGVCVALM